jgi:DNA-binding MarR family transcriptional regulator
MNTHGRAFGFIAAVFVIGVASGAVGMHVYELKMHTPPVITIDYQEDSHAALDEMAKQLRLNDSQRERVQAILDECIMEEAELLMRVKQIQQAGRGRILEVLEPEQREDFETLFSRASQK